MIWPFTRAKQTPEPTHDQEARHAIERARHAVDEAKADLSEMRRETGNSRHQREVNHFAPLIFDSMRRPGTK